jgi:hypothetical protein
MADGCAPTATQGSRRTRSARDGVCPKRFNRDETCARSAQRSAHRTLNAPPEAAVTHDRSPCALRRRMRSTGSRGGAKARSEGATAATQRRAIPVISRGTACRAPTRHTDTDDHCLSRNERQTHALRGRRLWRDTGDGNDAALCNHGARRVRTTWVAPGGKPAPTARSAAGTPS